MKRLNLIATVVVVQFLAGTANAHHRNWWQWWYNNNQQPTRVPEIDASAGLLALAAVLASLVFIWERRRRRTKSR